MALARVQPKLGGGLRGVLAVGAGVSERLGDHPRSGEPGPERHSSGAGTARTCTDRVAPRQSDFGFFRGKKSVKKLQNILKKILKKSKNRVELGNSNFAGRKFLRCLSSGAQRHGFAQLCGPEQSKRQNATGDWNPRVDSQQTCVAVARKNPVQEFPIIRTRPQSSFVH